MFCSNAQASNCHDAETQKKLTDLIETGVHSNLCHLDDEVAEEIPVGGAGATTLSCRDAKQLGGQ